MSHRVFISAGDGIPASGDYLDLNDDDTFGILDGTLSVFERPGEISFALDISGRDQAWLDRYVSDLWRMLGLAERGQQRITLGFQLDGSGDMRYADVIAGSLSIGRDVLTSGNLVSSIYRGVPLTFQCLPLLRSDPIAYATSATQTSGVDSTYYLANVPGTAPALLQLLITDVSTGSKFLQKLRIGVWGDRYLASAAGYSAIVDAAARSPGSIVSGAAHLASLTADWQDVADFAIATRGALRIVLRAKDSATATAAALFSITTVTQTTTGSPTLPADSYVLVMAAVDGSGNILSYSRPRTYRLLVSNRNLVVTYPAITGATDYRLYWQRGSNATLYKALGSAGTTFTLANESGATTADAPTSVDIAVANAQLRTVIRSASGAILRTSQYPVSFKISNGVYEAVEVFVDDSPIPRSEGALPDSWIPSVQAKSSGSNAPTVDLDLAMVFPAGPGQYAEVWYPETTALAALRGFNVVPDRNGYQIAYLTNAGTEAGRLRCTPSALQIGPGPAVIMVQGDVQGGLWDTTNGKFTVTPTVIPRWSSL